MFKNITLTLILTLIVCGSLFSMSFFSTAHSGLGLKTYVPSARGFGMGMVGIALVDNIELNSVNAASWSDIRDTRMNFRFGYNRNSIDFGSESFTTATGKFGGINLAVPIFKNKLFTGLSVQPYTDVDFSFQREISNDAADYNENVFYKGGISRIQANLVYAPTSKISLAAAFHYYFGNIEDRHQRVFDDPDFYDSSTEINYKVYGPGIGLSGRVQVLSPLYLGGFVDLKPNLKMRKIVFNPLTRLDEETTSESSLPLKWGIGSSYFITKRLVIAADYAKQNWSEGFGVAGMNTTQLDDWYHFGFGLERIHVNSRKASTLDKFDIRAGLSFSNLGYKFNNETVDQTALHLGFGFPFYKNTARLDIGIMAGVRGDKNKTIAQEKFFQLNVSISAGELWFQKFR